MNKLNIFKSKPIRISLLVIIFSTIVNIGFAQKFYVTAGGGYAFQAGKTGFINADPNNLTSISPSLDVNISTTGQATVNDLSGTLGEGLKINVAGGYKVSDHLALELGVTYQKGTDVVIGRYQDPTITEETSAYIDGVLLKPSLVLNPGFSGINPYVRAGLVLTAAGKLYVDTKVDVPDGAGAGVDVAVEAQTVVEPNFSVGYGGAIGALIPVNEKISVFAEMEFKNFTIKPKEAEIEKFSTMAITGAGPVEVTGAQLSDFPVSAKKFIFSDSYQYSTTQAPDTSVPSTIPVQYVNAGSVGLNIGIKFNL